MSAESAGEARRRRLRTGLGTFIAIEASAPSPEQVDAGIEAAFAAIAAVEQRMHPSRPGSDLARINAVAAELATAACSLHSPRSTRVHRSTWELLQLAKQLNELSGGVFDPCLPCRPGVLSDVELLSGLEVRCHAPVKLDFGGFAKGYAVDEATEALMRHGCTAGLVNAGGDLRVFGTRPETMLLQVSTGEVSPLAVSNTAVAVSRAVDERRPPEHAGYYLRKANTAGTRRTTAVTIASRAVIADALTKCALLCTERRLARLMQHFRDAALALVPAA